MRRVIDFFVAISLPVFYICFVAGVLLSDLDLAIKLVLLSLFHLVGIIPGVMLARMLDDGDD